MLTRVRSELVLTFGARCMVIIPVTVSRARPRITLHYEPSCLLKLNVDYSRVWPFEQFQLSFANTLVPRKT